MAQSKRRSSSNSKKSGTAAKGQSGGRAAGSSGSSASSGSRNSGARSSSRSGSGSRSDARMQAGARQPVRREIMAALCLLLGILSFIGYFDSEPLFIAFFTGFAKRLIGAGFFALPPALIMCAVILAFHKGYPVLLRIISTLSLTAAIGALIHTFSTPLKAASDPGVYEVSFGMFKTLWTQGAELKAGGVISGSLSQVFLALFGSPGTVVTLIIILAILALIAFNATISGVLGAFSKRDKLYYEPQIDEDEGDMSEEEIEHRERHRRKYRYPLIPLWKKKKIDIPLDEKKKLGKDYFADDPMSELYNKTPGVPSPDAVLQGAHGAEPGATDVTADMQRQGYDLPLDIPFMDGRMKRPEPPPPACPEIEEVNFMNKPGQAPLSQNPENYFTKREPTDKVPMRSKRPVLFDDEKADTPVAAGGTGIAAFGAAAGAAAEGVAAAGAASTTKKSEIDIPLGYAYPGTDLLGKGDDAKASRAANKGEEEAQANIDMLEAAFQSFGINVNITNAVRGPSVTRYEAELEAGVKLSRLTNLSDDIALALGTLGVRIAAMPNKRSTVGIEVPNKNVSKVFLRDIIESDEFNAAHSKLTFAIGMDISGERIVGDISKLPHLLIAGTTGSGKSVCLNSIILSLLYKATPKEVRLIMVDPKMVEFKVYANIPHLLVPLVTEASKASGALQWATHQMMKRYNLFAELGARDIEGYNKQVVKSDDDTEPLPRIVIIIDELADLMLTAAKEVEESVCRIAQMGRAAGIHLVIATQSPRANVITGLMKANIPSRIAFKVASALESQIILDPGQNADKLVGNGDMLYSPTGIIKPMRVQGTWVSDNEREKVVDFLKEHATVNFDDEATHEINKIAEEKQGTSDAPKTGNRSDSYDDLLPSAVELVLDSGQGQVSVSMLQRRMSLGYARAARIVDQMEEMGIVGQFEGSKPRTLLISKAQWQQMQFGTGTAPIGKAPDFVESESEEDVESDNEDE